MMPTFFQGLQSFQTGLIRLVSSVSGVVPPDRDLVGLKAQIRVLDGICRVVSPWRRPEARWEETAVRLQSELSRAEAALARRHAENLFSNVIFCRLAFLTPFGAYGSNFDGRDDVFRTIEAEGMDGYVDLLVAAINQHWAPVLMWEKLRGTRFDDAPGYDEMDDCNGPSVAILLGLLRAIGSDGHVERRFRARWNAFSPLHPLEDVRDRVDTIVVRYQREFLLQSLL